VTTQHICPGCGRNWSAGDFDPDCRVCGGGALERDCVVCGGRCGRTWSRAVLDSIDSGEAHWVGGCGLPMEEQIRLMREDTSR
jgi:hypothetical protein